MKYIFLLVCFMQFFETKAQMIIKLGDSKAYLKNVEDQFSTAATDSIKAYTALKLSHLYKREKDMGKMKYYLDQGIALSKGNAFLEATTHYYTAFSMFGEPDMAAIESHLRQGDSLLTQFDHPEANKVRGNSWVVLGVLEQMKGSEQAALNAYLNHALPLAQKSGDQFLIANVNKFIGIIFLNANEREKAADYLDRAMTFFEQASVEEYPNKPEAIVETTILIAENYVQLRELDKAKTHLDKAKRELEPYPGSNVYLFYYYPEGAYYDRLGMYENAINSYDKGIAMGGGNAENYYVNRMKYGKFESLMKMKDYTAAIAVMEDLLKSPILLTLDKRVYMKKLADAYAQTGSFKDAYHWSEKYTAFRDSLYDAKYEANLIELEKKYEIAQKENEILVLEAEKQAGEYAVKTAKLTSQLWAIGCMWLLVTVAFLIYFLRNSKKLTKQKVLNHRQQLRDLAHQQELKLARAILAGEEKERQRIARDLHDGLGGALSGIKIKLSGQPKAESTQVVDEAILQLENSIGELRRIARNMMPETLIRLGLETALRDLCVSLTNRSIDIEFQANGIEEKLPVETQVHIYRIVQELLSNAIRHSQADRIIVQCLQNEDTFLVTVEDNGKGFDPSLKKSAGIGLGNIQNRVAFLKGRIEIDAAIDQGTTVNLEFHV